MIAKEEKVSKIRRLMHKLSVHTNIGRVSEINSTSCNKVKVIGN